MHGKSLLFCNDKTWIKKNDLSLFDVIMGSYDGAEVCELVGLFLLKIIADIFGKDSVGLYTYRDDGLILLKGTGGRQAELTRKQLHEIFKKQDFRITTEINYHTVNFLDVTLNLNEEKYQPYRKPNNTPLYIDSRSNHPPCIIKQLPASINRHLSSLSSDAKSFESNAPLYQDALHRSTHHVKLSYSKTTKEVNLINLPQEKHNLVQPTIQ